MAENKCAVKRRLNGRKLQNRTKLFPALEQLLNWIEVRTSLLYKKLNRTCNIDWKFGQIPSAPSRLNKHILIPRRGKELEIDTQRIKDLRSGGSWVYSPDGLRSDLNKCYRIFMGRRPDIPRIHSSSNLENRNKKHNNRTNQPWHKLSSDWRAAENWQGDNRKLGFFLAFPEELCWCGFPRHSEQRLHDIYG